MVHGVGLWKSARSKVVPPITKKRNTLMIRAIHEVPTIATLPAGVLPSQVCVDVSPDGLTKERVISLSRALKWAIVISSDNEKQPSKHENKRLCTSVVPTSPKKTNEDFWDPFKGFFKKAT